MTIAEAERRLKNGGKITKGAFSGYWLIDEDGKHRINSIQALKMITKCKRVDDETTRCGATWMLPETTEKPSS